MLLTQCCDHPYLVDPNLRNSFKEDASIDSLDVDINVSGKLQLLDKFLSEIKQCGFRVVVLFQVTNLLKFYSNCQGPLCHFFLYNAWHVLSNIAASGQLRKDMHWRHTR